MTGGTKPVILWNDEIIPECKWVGICHPLYDLNNQVFFLNPVRNKHHSVIDRCPFGAIIGFYSTEAGQRVSE